MWGVLVGSGALWLVAELYLRLRKIEGMGFGDVKLAAMFGAVLGWQLTLITLFIAALAGSLWGGYLMWSLYPDYRVFVDGRGLIPEVFFQEVRVLEASQKPVEGMAEWKAILNAYKVDFIVTFSVGNFTGRLVPLIPALLNDPEWHLIYMDNISLMFARDSAGNRELISRFGIPKEWAWNEVAVEAALKAKDAPNRANYFETMGDAFFAKRSYQEAREAYFKAFELTPDSTRLRSRIEQLDAIIRAQGQ
jgi:tetratricopeptide (TPR) repeat protein